MEANNVVAIMMKEFRSRQWDPVRIEDRFSTGTPDINIHVRRGPEADEGDVWIEAKEATLTKLTPYPMKDSYSIKYRPAQTAFLVRGSIVGRRCFMVIRLNYHQKAWIVLTHAKQWRIVSRIFSLDDLTRCGKPYVFWHVTQVADFLAQVYPLPLAHL